METAYKVVPDRLRQYRDFQRDLALALVPFVKYAWVRVEDSLVEEMSQYPSMVAEDEETLSENITAQCDSKKLILSRRHHYRNSIIAMETTLPYIDAHESDTELDPSTTMIGRNGVLVRSHKLLKLPPEYVQRWVLCDTLLVRYDPEGQRRRMQQRERNQRQSLTRQRALRVLGEVDNNLYEALRRALSGHSILHLTRSSRQTSIHDIMNQVRVMDVLAPELRRKCHAVAKKQLPKLAPHVRSLMWPRNMRWERGGWQRLQEWYRRHRMPTAAGLIRDRLRACISKCAEAKQAQEADNVTTAAATPA